MTLQTAYHRDSTGRSLYAFPFTQDISVLADWDTYKVELVETPASSENYQASLDDSIDTLWRIFEGSGQPSSIADSLFSVIQLDTPSTNTASLGVAERDIGSTVPIDFVWPVTGATITGTKGDGTPLQGAISFLQTEGSLHWYRIAYDADDVPSVAGTVGYVLTDGTYQKNLSLVVSAGGGGSGTGTGIYTLTITTQDSGANGLQGSRVSLAGTSLGGTTDSLGSVVFGVDDGTYTVVISPPAGYDTPTPIVVDMAASNQSSSVTLTESSGGTIPWPG